ncbi:MAG: hypothetical protein KatS3mg115_2126 [Candidatus Poribacteria bacterium]|nr:MAG: hypothetical protein KatS3mg115_2126 [Candidatus Poribacteria bacterium]
MVADDKLASDVSFQAALRKVFRVGQFGIVQGTIVDPQGRPIPEAVVTLINEQGATLAAPATSSSRRGLPD